MMSNHILSSLNQYPTLVEQNDLNNKVVPEALTLVSRGRIVENVISHYFLIVHSMQPAQETIKTIQLTASVLKLIGKCTSETIFQNHNYNPSEVRPNYIQVPTVHSILFDKGHFKL